MSGERKDGLKRNPPSNKVMNAREITKFIKNAVKDLYPTDSSATWYLRLDDDFAIYIGWSGGFDEKDEYALHSASQPEYCLCAKVAEYRPWDADYVWMNMPWDKETGEVWDNETIIAPESNMYSIAVWLNKEYRGMRKALRNGEITFGND